MTNKLSTADTFGLGFMTFAFFLGAGNIIFPPLAGMQAGTEVLPAMFGFLATAVGLPLLGLFAVAKVGGGIPTMTASLPKWIGVSIAVAIFIIIGPLIAAPRTALVAFELGVQPFTSSKNGSLQLYYSIGFFILAALLSLYPGKLMDSIGKVLTPLLMLLLLVLSATVLLAEPTGQATAITAYQESPFSKGFIEGYNTMDALASIMFGMLIMDLLKKKGLRAATDQYRYLVIAALIAATGLAIVYISLFFLGANNATLVENATNGGQILSAYVELQFGFYGLVILAAVITLACLTTAVGLLSACSDYFSSLTSKVSYAQFVIINAIACVAVANLDLSQLISLSIPVLVASYPIAIALILYSLSHNLLACPHIALIVTLSISALFGLIEGLKAAGADLSALSFLPLYDQGMAWIAPTVAALLIFILLNVFKSK